MSDENQFAVRLLPEQGGKELVFNSPDELTSWCDKLKQDWRWLSATAAQRAFSDIDRCANAIHGVVNDWRRNPSNLEVCRRTQQVSQNQYNTLTNGLDGFFSSEASVSFIKESKRGKGDDFAAGALTALTGIGTELNASSATGAFFSGVIHGFLFRNEVDWTATHHQKLLLELEAQAHERLRTQDDRLKQLEDANMRLNADHQQKLEGNDAALEELKANKEKDFANLRTEQEKAFVTLTSEFEQKYQAIKKLYTDELALRAPVQYWKASHKAHRNLAWCFAGLSIAVLAGFAWALICTIQWAFGSLGPNDNPKPWEVGVVVVSTFFAVWIIRIIVRLFLSHQHLATDAAQRVTMVQTFLALSQEDGGVSKEDRSIVLQQLFKSTSDGLVKEDGTPPGWIEYLTRSKGN